MHAAYRTQIQGENKKEENKRNTSLHLGLHQGKGIDSFGFPLFALGGSLAMGKVWQLALTSISFNITEHALPVITIIVRDYNVRTHPTGPIGA